MTADVADATYFEQVAAGRDGKALLSAAQEKTKDPALKGRLVYEQVRLLLARRIALTYALEPDAAAISLCMENDIPIQIFNIRVAGIMSDVVMGREVGSWVGPGEAL